MEWSKIFLFRGRTTIGIQQWISYGNQIELGYRPVLIIKPVDTLLPKPDNNSFGSAWVYGRPSDAFDNDESTAFCPDIGTNAMNLYVGYNFQKAVKCYKVEVSFGKYGSAPNFDYQIEGLKEDGTWEAISEVLTCNDELLQLVVNTTNNKPHTSYRLKGLTDAVIHVQNHYNVQIKELKFYCLE